jgi:acid phosphatase type 7
VIGNHEYGTMHRPRINRGEGYWDYFGPRVGPRYKGWYSYNVGKWHLIALNSNCWAVGGYDGDSPQGEWLARDLERHADTRCILAYWHHPRFSSGRSGNENNVQPMWRRLIRMAKADVVLAGHDHVYERFSPQSAFGTSMPTGIRQFTVGTGGKNLGDFVTRKRDSVVRRAEHGVLKLRLLERGYRWSFVTTSGRHLDRGSAKCV